MKANFIKQVIPVAVFALAIAGAFTTNAMNVRSKTVATVQGYVKLNPQGTSCEQRDMCSTINNGNICTVGLIPGGTPLFAKNSANQCTVTVYRP
ncbi:hypothetical protein IWX83_002969 [Flavobacterium sp. CG_9.1]|jgi:hypothetical protein|uniref:DUF6520 family protein n=2 Tax=Flavobacterium TaxID=237 RepID=UPI0018CA1949|nr:DUF6520 family protein [Flavobacterium sp. CG_9.1]MBG6063159.1 hypothetical protein [Flavobacterium sp. CG_9.1]